MVVGILFLCHDQKVRRTFATEIVTFGGTRQQGQRMRREGSSAKVTPKDRTLCSACDNQKFYEIYENFWCLLVLKIINNGTHSSAVDILVESNTYNISRDTPMSLTSLLHGGPS